MKINDGGITMTHEEQVKRMTDMMAKFIGFTGKKLPDDVIAKLTELADRTAQQRDRGNAQSYL